MLHLLIKTLLEPSMLINELFKRSLRHSESRLPFNSRQLMFYDGYVDNLRFPPWNIQLGNCRIGAMAVVGTQQTRTNNGDRLPSATELCAVLRSAALHWCP